MSDVARIECKSCGASADFDVKTQMIHCAHCGKSYKLSEYNECEDILEDEEVEVAGDDLKIENFEHDLSKFKKGIHPWGNAEEEGMSLYSCNACGAEVFVSNVSGTAKCPFCDNNLVFTEQFTGDLKPDFIIPFKKSKEDAVNGYYDFLKSKSRYLPGIFKSQNHIDEIQGIYVPYWLFDADFDAEYIYKAKKIETWEAFIFEFTKTSYLDIYRNGNISFKNIPRDASLRMENDLLDSIEPFDVNEAEDFSTYYIAGFMAERFDVPAEDCVKEAVDRMESTIISEVEKTIGSYDELRKHREKVTLKEGEIKYALYPVWYLNTSYKDKHYSFVMNGQTGKMVSNDLPKDPLKVILFMCLFSLIAFVVLLVILMCIIGFYSIPVALIGAPILGIIIGLIDSYNHMRTIEKVKEAAKYIENKLVLSRKEDKLIKSHTKMRIKPKD